METKPNIEARINETLDSAKKLNQVDVPAFFTERTINRLRTSGQDKYAFSYTSVLKMAAAIILLVVNIYTIRYIISPKQENVATTTASVKDLLNEYQPNDAGDLAFDQNFDK